MNAEVKAKLYAKADRLRQEYDFDCALEHYDEILAEKPTEAAAYWGLVLCKYKVVYTGEAGQERLTCYQYSYKPVMEDEDYKLALQYASKAKAVKYQEEAKKIEEAQKELGLFRSAILKEETEPVSFPSVRRMVAQHSKMGQVEAGEHVYFGSYPTGKSGERQPIQWRVLKNNGSRIMLLSEKGLDMLYYGGQTWGDSGIRKWLNHDFINIAFTKEEQSVLATTTVSNKTLREEDTKDRVYLLSAKEVFKKKDFFQSTQDRICEGTPYAEEIMARVRTYLGKDIGGWWLRSSRSENVFLGKYGQYGGAMAVRPVLWVKLKGKITSGSDTEKQKYEAVVNYAAGMAKKASLEAAEKIEGLKEAEVGETLYLGSYPTEENGERKPILWRVLKKENRSLLLLSEYVIDISEYDARERGDARARLNRRSLTWERSGIRAWLNGGFFHTALTPGERLLVAETELNNRVQASSLDERNTKDKVFLLCREELKNWPTAEERNCTATEYVQNMIYGERRKKYRWLLRLREGDEEVDIKKNSFPLSGAVDPQHVIYNGGPRLMPPTNAGIKPALWINLDADISFEHAAAAAAEEIYHLQAKELEEILENSAD